MFSQARSKPSVQMPPVGIMGFYSNFEEEGNLAIYEIKSIHSFK